MIAIFFVENDSLSVVQVVLLSFLFLLIRATSEAPNFRFGRVGSLLDFILHFSDVLLVLLHVGQNVEVVDGCGAA